MSSDQFVDQSCRICLDDVASGVLIFSDEGKDLYLQAKIKKYLYITVTSEDILPKIICNECCKKLESIHKFATMANKNQDKFLSTTNTETKQQENKGLLHTYLTKGTKDNDFSLETEVTEMEVGLDPMMVVQCSLEEDEDLESPYPYSSEEFDERSETENCSDSSESYLKQFSCSFCPRRFVSEFQLLVHTWSHPAQHKRILSNKNQEDCEELSAEEENPPGALDGEDGEKLHGVRYACPVCGKTVSTKGNLKVHVETHRPKGKYACDICGRIFKTQCNLHRHKDYHGFPQFPCTVCGRVYPTNSTLRAHSITHSDVRPHKCPLCIKTFKRNQDLKFHINQHTGARPYQCPYCPKAFASSGNCFSHRKRMHPMEVERDRERAAKIIR